MILTAPTASIEGSQSCRTTVPVPRPLNKRPHLLTVVQSMPYPAAEGRGCATNGAIHQQHGCPRGAESTARFAPSINFPSSLEAQRSATGLVHPITSSIATTRTWLIHPTFLKKAHPARASHSSHYLKVASCQQPRNYSGPAANTSGPNN